MVKSLIHAVNATTVAERKGYEVGVQIVREVERALANSPRSIRRQVLSHFLSACEGVAAGFFDGMAARLEEEVYESDRAEQRAADEAWRLESLRALLAD